MFLPTYNKPTSVEPVDMEERLKAEHVVESASDIQFCAITSGRPTTYMSSRIRILIAGFVDLKALPATVMIGSPESTAQKMIIVFPY